MQRLLIIAIAIAAVVLAVLLVRRATRPSAPSAAIVEPASDLFRYEAEIELGAAFVPDAGLPPLGMLALRRGDLDRACDGDSAAIDVVREAMATQLMAHPNDASLRVEIASLPDQCFEPPRMSGLCSWAGEEIERQGARTDAAWLVLTHCPADIALPLFDQANAPAEEVLAFVSARAVGSAWLRPPARLPAQYARAVIELSQHPSAAPSTSAALVRYADPVAATALVDAYQATSDTAQRLTLVAALAQLVDAPARAVVDATCASVPTLAACIDPRPVETSELILDAPSYVARLPAERARVIGDLDACARGLSITLAGPPATCLTHLATLDGVRARTVASELDTHADPGLAGVVRSLTQYPSADALALALRSRDLLGEPTTSDVAGVTVVSTMAQYGRAWMLGPTSLQAFGHDRLARHLLRLAAIDDVEVNETLPSDDIGLAVVLGRPTRLHARTHGDTFGVTTRSDGDYFDLDAVVGLLNVVARARGANVRFLVVVDPLVEEAIVLGTPGELASAVAQGLLEVPGPTAPTPNLPF